MTGDASYPLDLSIVIPIFNERENVRPLVEDVQREVGRLGLAYEVILVNDGSTDGSEAELDAVAREHPEVKVVHFAYNCGQTAAMAAGMECARGRVLVTMDGDRQNDPADIAVLLAKLEEGYACVSGWRRDRRDTGPRRWISRAANGLIRRLSGVPVHDLGCTLKAYRADAVDPSELFGEMHRFLPHYVMARGGRVAELVVRHHPRTAGQSKYGFGRISRVISDMFLVRLLLKYRTRPSHLMAKVAQSLVLLGVLALALSIVVQGVLDISVWWVGWLTAVMLWIGAVLQLGIGMACELTMRNRYLVADRRPWVVKRTVNLETDKLAGVPGGSSGPEVESTNEAQ